MADRTEDLHTIELPHGMLYATEDSLLAEKLAAAGENVLGILTDGNETEPFRGVRYLIGKDTLRDKEYLDQILCRMMGLPVTVLETKRCILRESVPEDAGDFYRIYEDGAVKTYMEPLYEPPQEEEYLRQYRENVYAFYEYGIWTVVYKENGQIIGRAGIDPVEGEGPQLGYVIEKDYRGRGIAEEVCGAIIDYAGSEFSLSCLTAVTHKDNAASCRLLEKLGFAGDGEPDGKNIKYFLNFTR